MDARFGRFYGNLDLRILRPPSTHRWWEWLIPTRPLAQVMSDFEFVEPDGTHWATGYGDITNGISTPWCFWRLMPPFAWREIRASALHDKACTVKSRPSWRVHRMMYHAMRCDHASPIRAWTAWCILRVFGPRF